MFSKEELQWIGFGNHLFMYIRENIFLFLFTGWFHLNYLRARVWNIGVVYLLYFCTWNICRNT